MLNKKPEDRKFPELIERIRHEYLLKEKPLDKAMEEYGAGNFEKAVAILRKAGKIDPQNRGLQGITIKILMDSGMEASLNGDHSTALRFFEEARGIDPSSSEIPELIRVSKKMIHQEPDRAKIRTGENLPEIKTLFRNYQSRQEKLITEYLKTEKNMQSFIEQFEAEKKNFYKTLEEKENKIEFLLSEKEEKEAGSGLYKKFLPLLFLTIILLSLFSYLGRRSPEKADNPLIMEEKEPVKDLTPLEKKIKKIGILAGEFTRDDIKERDAALLIIIQYLRDKNDLVKIEAIKALYRLEPKLSLETISKNIHRDNFVLALLSSRFLIEAGSPQVVYLLFDLSHSINQKIKKESIDTLITLYKLDSIPHNLKEEIKLFFEQDPLADGWVVL